MKIRLRVRTSAIEPYEWEHLGSRIRIGKEGCQLSFRGEDGVSRRHAEIELSSSGAMLRDAGSTNGTYLNGAPVRGSVRLSVGDEIGLGLAGPRLEVLSLELSALAETMRLAGLPSAGSSPHVASAVPGPTMASPTMADQRSAATHSSDRRRTGVIAAGLAGVTLVAAVVIVMRGWQRSTKNESPKADNPQPVVATTAANEEKATPKETEPVGPASTPSPPPAPGARKPMEEVVKGYEPAMVWIGFELDEAQFVYATGWVLRPKIIVTSGETAENLALMVSQSQSTEYGQAKLIARDVRGTIGIKEFRVHPEYSASQTEGDVNISKRAGHNVAVAILADEMPLSCSLASDTEIEALNVASPLLAAGFANEAGTKEPYDKVKNLVRLETKSARVTASDPPGAQRPLSYILRVADADSLTGPMESFDGAAVFNEQGHVVGLLTVVGSSVRMTSLTNIHNWLDGISP
jgi:hypothetical protein